MRNLVIFIGFLWIGFVIYLMFANWKAAIAILLFQIALNTGRTVFNTKRKIDNITIFGGPGSDPRAN